MKVTAAIDEVRAARWASPTRTWGLVPTMGALHAGHLELVRRARAENDCVGVSIYVNPKQFNNPGDLAAYPRDLDADARLLQAEGVDLVWTPSDAEMYPPGYQTYVNVEQVTQPLEGAARPGHFQGVTTVVTKLFNVFQPTRAYFGQKDAQQVAVVAQMVRDLNVNLELVVCPIVREADGLALSSRNVRLTPAQRAAAVVLNRALQSAAAAWAAGERDADFLRAHVTAHIAAEPLARSDYVSVAHPVTLAEQSGPVDAALISLAVYFGAVRLIDNVVLGA